MRKTKIVELELKDGFDSDIKIGELFLHNDEIYRFDGYDFGTYPMATNIKTGKQISL